jgi:hypothetical protein
VVFMVVLALEPRRTAGQDWRQRTRNLATNHPDENPMVVACSVE